LIEKKKKKDEAWRVRKSIKCMQ